MEIFADKGLLHIIRKSTDYSQNIQFIFNNSGEKKCVMLKNEINCLDNKAIDGEVSLENGEFIAIKQKNV